MLGIVLSVLGIVATFFATKWSERRKKISNFTKNEFSIGKSLRKEFPDLDLTYKYKTVINDLRVYKGILMNTGHKDIPENGGDNKITVIFPDGCLIRGVNIKQGKVKVNSSIGPDSNKFDLLIGLFQEDECFEYDVIYEDTNRKSDNIADEIRFEYRIEDVAKQITNEQLPIEDGDRKLNFIRILNVGITILSFCASVFLLCFINLYEIPLQLSAYSNLDNTEVRVYSESDTTYKVCAKEMFEFSHSGVSIPKTEFKTNYHVEIHEHSELAFISLCIYIIIFLYFFVTYKLFKKMFDMYKCKKIKEKVESLDKKK